MSQEIRVQKQVKVWAGRFASRASLDAYFYEMYEDDEEGEQPCSAFAAGQGAGFYDHDMLEVSFSPEPARDIRPFLKAHSFSTSYLDAVADSVFQENTTPVNTVVLFFGEGLEQPRPVSGEGFDLAYLGSFSYDPGADSVEVQRLSDAGIPASVRLELQTPGEVWFQGRAVRAVEIGSQGLVIGHGSGAGSDLPYLDVAGFPNTNVVAPVQARVYRDRFDQWVIEDHGHNGLTQVDGTVLNGERSMPWHESRLSVGPVEFLWDCFPEVKRG